MNETPTQSAERLAAVEAGRPLAEMIRVPDLRQGDVIVTETGVYRVTWPPRYYHTGPGLPAGIPCWHIPVGTIAGAPRGGLVRADWDYMQRFTEVGDG